jgi:5-(carboxyamino)imidazole ribonucleotide mutase
LSEFNSSNIYKIAVVMGSDSDLKTLKPAIDILNEFEIENEVCILSAHRTPMEMMEYAKKAESENIKVIIAGAGGAAHLPGMIASNMHTCHRCASRE